MRARPSPQRPGDEALRTPSLHTSFRMDFHMKLSTLLVATALMLGASGNAFSANTVTMSKLTRQFVVTTNLYDAGSVGGKTYTDLAVVSVGASATIDPNEVTSGYNITATNFKGLPWNSAFQQTPMPAGWPTTPYNSQVSLRFFIDLSTPTGKAMYANLLVGQETKGLLTVSIDYDAWISGTGFKLVQVQVDQ